MARACALVALGSGWLVMRRCAAARATVGRCDWAILGCGYRRHAPDPRAPRRRRPPRPRLRAQPRSPRAARRARRRGPPLDAAKSRAFGPALYGTAARRWWSTRFRRCGQHARGRAARAAPPTRVGCRRRVETSSISARPRSTARPRRRHRRRGEPDRDRRPGRRTRIADESAVEIARLAGLSTVVLRLAAIYGPGRGVRERLKAGSYKLIDEGVHFFSRVHVDDMVGIVRASAERAPAGAVYCVADDRPTTQREYSDWLTARLGTPPLPSVPSLAQGAPRRGGAQPQGLERAAQARARLHLPPSFVRRRRAGDRRGARARRRRADDAAGARGIRGAKGYEAGQGRARRGAGQSLRCPLRRRRERVRTLSQDRRAALAAKTARAPLASRRAPVSDGSIRSKSCG